MRKTEAQEDKEKEPGRSTKGGQAILAGHRAPRLRRGGSSFAQYQAEKLEEIGQTATQEHLDRAGDRHRPEKTRESSDYADRPGREFLVVR